MIFLRFCLLAAFFLLLGQPILYSQSIEKHLWKKRVLLIYTPNKSDSLFINELSKIKVQREELKDLKLVVYQFTDSEFSCNFSNFWKNSNLLFKRFIKDNDSSQYFLIGLDGELKFSSKTPIPIKNIFTIIDGMPIRKAELRKNNK